MLAPNSLVSLNDMLELNAQFFLGAATELRRLNTILSTFSEPQGSEDVDAQTRSKTGINELLRD